MKSIIALFCLVVLVGCGEKKIKPRIENPETTPTQIWYDVVSLESKNGVKSYRMTTPLMESYEQAESPFSEFTKGIMVETFNDTTRVVQSDLKADYARFNSEQEVWEVRGNVIGRNMEDDRTIITEQLFWDQKRDKIFTDKFATLIDGKSIHQGTGFEADGDLKRWIFKSTRGRLEVMTSDSTASDSTAVGSTLQVSPEMESN